VDERIAQADKKADAILQAVQELVRLEAERDAGAQGLEGVTCLAKALLYANAWEKSGMRWRNMMPQDAFTQRRGGRLSGLEKELEKGT
jgi:hypothetical protein